MKRNTYRLAIIAAIFVVISACQDSLNIADPNRLSTASYYTEPAHAVAAIDAIYNELITDGFYQRIIPVYNDGRGDELYCKSPWGFLTGFSNFTLPATDGALDIFWFAHYRMINRANQALEHVPDVPGVESGLQGRLMGQAHFLRALAYFNLTNVHDNVPLILATPAGSESFYPSNKEVTQEMVYAQVEEDLQAAVAALPVTYTGVSGPDNGQTGRATKGAAQALLGKLYLYQKKYTQAQEQFAAVISSGQYSLAENYADLFSQDPAIERSNPGKIFWAEFTTSTNSDFNWGGGDPNQNWRQMTAITPTYSRNDFDDFRPTRFLYDEMRKEKTKDGKFDERYHATLLSYEPSEGYTKAFGEDWFVKGYQATDYFIKKYTHGATGGDAFAAGYNYHIIRYADVLLMQAECLANSGNVAQAAALVQQVRNRANLPDRTSEFAAMSLPQFMAQIEHERIMEFAVEGLRWYDLKRWGKLDSSLNELKAHDAEFNTYTPNKLYIPISQLELDRNPNLVGNAANG